MFMPVWDVGLFDLVDGCGFVEFGLSGCVFFFFFLFFLRWRWWPSWLLPVVAVGVYAGGGRW